MKYTMKEMPETEKPYEKCLKNGAEFLTDAELLAVILRTGSKGVTALELARNILESSKVENNLLGLYHMSIPGLMKIKGIGKVKAIQLKCIAELSRRMAKRSAGEGKVFTSASDIAAYYMEDFRHCDQEKVLLLMFNSKCKLLGEKLISKGTVNQSCISPREIFLEALEHHAVYIILIHNHPSGSARPSEEDILLTGRIKECGYLMGVDLKDHIVIGDQCYTSFLEEGLLE